MVNGRFDVKFKKNYTNSDLKHFFLDQVRKKVLIVFVLR